MGYQSEYIERVGEQCSGPIRSWEYYMVVGHKCFLYKAYTRIPRPEIIMVSYVISSML